MKRMFLYASGLAALAFLLSVALPSGARISAADLTASPTKASAETAYFVLEIPPRKDQFVIQLTDAAKIQKARDILSGKDRATPHVSGKIVKQSACYNPPWSFHFDPQSIEFFASAIEVCDASMAYTESYLSEAGGHFLPGNHWCPWGSRLVKEIPAPVCNNGVTSVSAANYRRVGLADESIVTAFGNGLATTTEIAQTVPLPTTLAGTTVTIKDSTGKETLAPLFFVSPTQVNYQIPKNTPPGFASVTIRNVQGQTATEHTQILTIAPGVFSANASGTGVPAAAALRIKANGSQTYEPVARFDAGQNRFVPVPIDLSNASDRVFLVLFATGVRHTNVENVGADIGELRVMAAYAGPQPDFTGLDQVNLPLPRQLAGRGEITFNLMVDDQKANAITIHIK